MQGILIHHIVHMTQFDYTLYQFFKKLRKENVPNQLDWTSFKFSGLNLFSQSKV